MKAGWRLETGSFSEESLSAAEAAEGAQQPERKSTYS
jgi:hypothetical protein